MRRYNSFLIRSWVVAGDDDGGARGEQAVFDVEHLQTSEHARAASLSEVRRLMEERLRAARPPRDATQPEGDDEP